MKMRILDFTAIVLLAATGFWNPLECDADVINLSNGDFIVNIDARLHGCGTWSGPSPPQPYWHLPTPTAPSVTLAAGTYTFRLVNPTDAASLHPELTSAELNSIFTAWTFNAPWIVNYMVFDQSAVGDVSQFQLFDGAQDPNTPGSSIVNANAAYNYAVSSGYFEKIRPAPPGRFGGPETFVTSWTFDDPITLLFVVPDTWGGLGDNGGGVSVLISSAVPEPSSMLFASASLAIAAIRFRRRSGGRCNPVSSHW